MDKIEKHVKNKLSKIIKELNKKEYSISQVKMLRMLNVISNTMFYYDDGEKNTISTFSSINKRIEIDTTPIRQSCVIEVAPDLIDNEIILVKPILYLKKINNMKFFDSIVYHELCHLLSIGDWKRLDSNSVEHITGLFKYKYIYENDEIIQKGDEVTFLSEEVNDCIAEILYNKIENKDYCTNYKKYSKNMQKYIQNRLKNKNSSIESFIGSYFNNDLDYIENVLNTEKNKNMKQLNDYLKEYVLDEKER